MSDRIRTRYSEAGKGDHRVQTRTITEQEWQDNYERTFGKKEAPQHTTKEQNNE